MTIVTWTLIGYDVLATYQGKNNVVSAVHYLIKATNGEQTAIHLDALDLVLNLTSFTQLSNLTSDDILNFVKDEFGSMTQQLEQALKNKVDLFATQGKNFIAAT